MMNWKHIGIMNGVKTKMKTTTKEELIAYKEYGIRTCPFLYAVLCNNLIDAICRADEENARDLKEIIRYVNDQLPWGCWGGPERINAWIKRGGIKGIEKKEEVTA